MIAIAHAAWSPGRSASLARLLAQVTGALVVTSETREHASVWAPRLWRRAYELAKPGEWCVFLNDDVEIAPNHAIETMLESASANMVSLATIQPEATRPGVRWLRSYCCTGPGYAIRRETVGDLLEFHAQKFTAGMRARMNEDEVIGHFAWSRQEPLLHCVPALVKHDVSVKSTLGYDNHPNRIASVLWDGEIPPWPPSDDAEYCPHPWMGEGRMRAVHRAITNGWDFDDTCVICADRKVLMQSPKTGAGICGQCLAEAVGHILTNVRIG